VTNLQTAECDVLVVGGGLAAMRAALEAARIGTRVIVACKRKVGRSGSSASTTGGYAAPVTEEDTWKHHLRDTLRGGANVGDPRLATALCMEALGRLMDLERAGAVFHKRDGRFSVSPSGDHSRPRVVVPLHYRGPDLTLPLRVCAEAAGCVFMEDLVRRPEMVLAQENLCLATDPTWRRTIRLALDGPGDRREHRVHPVGARRSAQGRGGWHTDHRGARGVSRTLVIEDMAGQEGSQEG